jgi:hypothetical protein
MQKIQKLYRKDYTGENLVSELIYRNQTWEKTLDHAPNRVENIQISERAVVIGNGPSRLQLSANNLFDLLKNHRGGLLSAGRVQTYGCNALIRDFTPDFLVATGNEIINEIAGDNWHDTNRYYERTIVYANADAVLNFPGKFYLIPQNLGWNSGALAAYLACFDGHKKVYLLGHDAHSGEQTVNYNVYAGTPGYPKANDVNAEVFFTQAMLAVMQTYSDVDFVRVVPTEGFYMPDVWRYQLNLRQIVFRDFTVEIDL